MDNKVRLINLLNEEGGSSFDPNDFTINPPVPYTEPDARSSDEVSVNMMIAGRRGYWNLRYFRINMEALFSGATLSVPFNESTDPSYILGQFNTAYGVDLDVNDYTVSLETDPETSITTATYTSTEGNLYCYGAFTIIDADIPTILPELNTLITQLQLTGFTYVGVEPPIEADEEFAQLYTYGIDFSDMATDLRGVTTIDQAFVDLINDAMPDLGLSYVDGPANFNLFGATIVYNGSMVNLPDGYTSSDDYTGIMVISLNRNYSAIVGNMYLNYNRPYVQTPINSVSGVVSGSYRIVNPAGFYYTNTSTGVRHYHSGNGMYLYLDVYHFVIYFSDWGANFTPHTFTIVLPDGRELEFTYVGLYQNNVRRPIYNGLDTTLEYRAEIINWLVNNPNSGAYIIFTDPLYAPAPE